MAKRNRNRQQVRASVPTSKTPQSLVSVIIPVHGRMDLLERCLHALPDAFGELSYDIVIVDNDSPKEEKNEFYPKLKGSGIRIFERSKNMGFPAACNFGASKTSSPYIFFLNSDVILAPKSAETTFKIFDDAKIGIAGMKLVFPESVDEEGLRSDIRPSNRVQHVGIAVNVRAETFHILSGWDANHPKVRNIHDAYMVTGAALWIRKNLFMQAGGFFEGYGLGTFEDCDLCMMIRQMGYGIGLDTSVYGIHYTGATSEKYNIGYPIQQNRLIFMQRWGQSLLQTDWIYW